jgi:hypothetical protein
MKSILTKHQVKKLTRKEYASLTGELADIYVKIRFDDECGNGHNTLSITGCMYEAGYKSDERMITAGCIHGEIIHAFPELKRACAFHLCSTDGPTHYIANSLYHASDKDCWGLRKGEKRQIRNGKTGQLAWKLAPVNEDDEECSHALYVDSDERPAGIVVYKYIPWCRIGEGKEPDLKAARACAIWPEASLEDFTEEKLEARLSALLAELRKIVESFGMTY